MNRRKYDRNGRRLFMKMNLETKEHPTLVSQYVFVFKIVEQI